MSYYLYKLGTVSLVSSCLLNLLIVSSSEAQITPDSSLGNENSIVTPNVTVKDALADLIEGGAIRDNNLLHSFEQFNVSDGGRVYFASPDGIANILTRVTGTNISEIFGVLGVDGAANLFLLNPNGIIFGENAALDVNGSFIATTADSYIFDNGFAYSASNPEAPPLLTINIPVGLQVGNNPGAIEVKGTGHNLTFEPFPFSINRDLRPKGLEVNSGNTLALIGGEINLTQGNLTAEQGRIELGSVETGSVSIIPSEDGFSFDYEAITDFQDINITQASSIDVSGNGSGNLQLQGKNISLLENSAIISSTIGAENGGDIKIAATDSVNIIGTQEGLFPSAIFKNIESGATGNNGDINIETRQLEISKNAFISNSVIGDGNGGNIEIIANQIKITDNPLTQGYSTGLFADSLGEKGNSGDISISASVVSVSEQGLIGLNNLSQGKVGNLTIIADNLLLQDGGIISSFQLNSSGDGGNISLTANNIELGGESNEGNSSLIFGSNINVDTDNSRSFKITADNLLVKDDAQISLANVASFTENNLEIKVKRLTIENSKIDIFNSAGGDDGGMIDIEAANLSISAGVIETSTFGEGNSANISIRADNLEIQGNNEGKFGGTGGIRSSVFEATRNPSGLDFNGGNGGNIDIIANNLTLINGGFISASTFGQGKAGNINIQAKNINVTGAIFEEVRTLTSDFFEEPTFDVELKLFSSSISTLSEGDSDAGTININTDTLNVTDRGNISVSSLGKGNSGNLNITATELNLDDSAIIEAKVNTGNRGNINLATENIFLRDNSEITVEATGTATGGNININNTENIVLLENSQIIADAIEGQGGNIEITSQGYFVSADSKITASSQFGLDGNIEVEILNSDRPIELDALPSRPINVTQQITSGCGLESDFTILGRGGLPDNPTQNIRSNTTWHDLRLIGGETTNTQKENWNSDRENEHLNLRSIVEAQAWKINEKGQIELFVVNPTSNFLQNQTKGVPCHDNSF